MTNVVAINSPEIPEFTVSFETFWTLYPRKVARKDASKAWMRLTLDEQTAAIVALVAWRPHWLKKDPEYIMHGATYINGARWEDELPRSPTVSAAAHVAFTSSPHEPVARGALPAHVLEALRKLTGRKP